MTDSAQSKRGELHDPLDAQFAECRCRTCGLRRELEHAEEVRERANSLSVRVEAENRRLWTGLLVYGNHRPQCGSYTAAACDCGWQQVQMEAERRG